MDSKEALKILTIFSMTYPNFEATAEKAILWASLLGDLSYEKAQESAFLYCRSEKYPPTPSSILELARAPKEPAEAIWARVRPYLSQGEIGRERLAKESQEVQDAIRSLGGFDKLRYSDSESVSYARKDFIRYLESDRCYQHKKSESGVFSLTSNRQIAGLLGGVLKK